MSAINLRTIKGINLFFFYVPNQEEPNSADSFSA